MKRYTEIKAIVNKYNWSPGQPLFLHKLHVLDLYEYIYIRSKIFFKKLGLDLYRGDEGISKKF